MDLILINDVLLLFEILIYFIFSVFIFWIVFSDKFSLICLIIIGLFKCLMIDLMWLDYNLKFLLFLFIISFWIIFKWIDKVLVWIVEIVICVCFSVILGFILLIIMFLWLFFIILNELIEDGFLNIIDWFLVIIGKLKWFVIFDKNLLILCVFLLLLVIVLI